MVFFERRRAVMAARRRLDEVALKIGAYDGTLLRERRTGGVGLNGPPGLSIVTLRPGTSGEALAAQITAAVAVGYRRPRTPPNGFANECGPSPRLGCLFPSTVGLPELNVETTPSGRTFRSIDFQIPDGYAGVVVSMHLHVEG